MITPTTGAQLFDELVSVGRSVPFGREKLPPETHQPWHRHKQAYITVVIKGEFEQTGYNGRHRVKAGDVLVQPSLDAHANRMRSAGIDIVRLPWHFDASNGGIYRGCDVDAICRLAQTDAVAAGELAQAEIQCACQQLPAADYWADALAADIQVHSGLHLTAWAEAKGLSREGVSRAFHQLFGVRAVQYRMEMRARRAWRDVLHSKESLTSLAFSNGFSDQPHLTRAIRAWTGLTPAQWRSQSQKFKTALPA